MAYGIHVMMKVAAITAIMVVTRRSALAVAFGIRAAWVGSYVLLWEELCVKGRSHDGNHGGDTPLRPGCGVRYSRRLGGESGVIVGGAKRYCGRSHALWEELSGL